jgi:hypothetical protein
MKLRELRYDEVTFTYSYQPEDTPLKGNVMVSGDAQLDRAAEADIQRRLERGDEYAWFLLKAEASWHDFSFTDYLGGVSLAEGDTDIQKYARSYHMDKEALRGLNESIKAVAEQLAGLVES